MYLFVKNIFPLSYMTQVDRALKGFESTAEWADLIAALTKLNRVCMAISGRYNL